MEVFMRYRKSKQEIIKPILVKVSSVNSGKKPGRSDSGHAVVKHFGHGKPSLKSSKEQAISTSFVEKGKKYPSWELAHWKKTGEHMETMKSNEIQHHDKGLKTSILDSGSQGKSYETRLGSLEILGQISGKSKGNGPSSENGNGSNNEKIFGTGKGKHSGTGKGSDNGNGPSLGNDSGSNLDNVKSQSHANENGLMYTIGPGKRSGKGNSLGNGKGLANNEANRSDNGKGFNRGNSGESDKYNNLGNGSANELANYNGFNNGKGPGGYNFGKGQGNGNDSGNGKGNGYISGIDNESGSLKALGKDQGSGQGSQPEESVKEYVPRAKDPKYGPKYGNGNHRPAKTTRMAPKHGHAKKESGEKRSPYQTLRIAHDKIPQDYVLFDYLSPTRKLF